MKFSRMNKGAMNGLSFHEDAVSQSQSHSCKLHNPVTSRVIVLRKRENYSSRMHNQKSSMIVVYLHNAIIQMKVLNG